ncbi:hypothetical protein ACH5RR_035752 [Cinchona calisaya]|uniref:Glutathione S-transferase n=1 Tax=Cinchona calisaya TaxID=153742 RepID=A0ABD2Y6N7_9GENT
MSFLVEPLDTKIVLCSVEKKIVWYSYVVCPCNFSCLKPLYILKEIVRSVLGCESEWTLPPPPPNRGRLGRLCNFMRKFTHEYSNTPPIPFFIFCWCYGLSVLTGIDLFGKLADLLGIESGLHYSEISERQRERRQRKHYLEKIHSGLVFLKDAFLKSSKGKTFFGGETIGYLDIALGYYHGMLSVREILNVGGYI